MILFSSLNCTVLYCIVGYWDSLDELRLVYRSGKQWDPESEPAERELLVRNTLTHTQHPIMLLLLLVSWWCVPLITIFSFFVFHLSCFSPHLPSHPTPFHPVILFQLKTWQNAVSRSLGWIGSTFTPVSNAKGDMAPSQTLSTPSAMTVPLEPPQETNSVYALSGFLAVFAVGLGVGALIMNRGKKEWRDDWVTDKTGQTGSICWRI